MTVPGFIIMEYVQHIGRGGEHLASPTTPTQSPEQPQKGPSGIRLRRLHEVTPKSTL